MQSIFLRKYENVYFSPVKTATEKHRYRILIDSLEIKSVNQFEKEINVPTSTIRKAIERNSDITGEVAKKIKTRYPDVNIEWLITGEGSVFKNKSSLSGVGEAEVPYNTKKDVSDYINNALRIARKIFTDDALTADEQMLMARIQKLVEERAENKKTEKKK